MDNFIVRTAEVKDAEGIAKIHVETWQSAYAGQVPDTYLQSLSIGKRTERWKDILSHPEDNPHTIVADDISKIVGFCSVSHCRDDDMLSDVGELWSIYVDKNNMRKGVGSALMKKGLECLKEQGYKKVTLWVLTSNEKTRKWYESKGWRVEGKIKREMVKDFEFNETRYMTVI